MRICLIIEGTYPWYRGGVSEWVYQYLKSLDNCSFSVLQIATDEFQGLDPSEALYPLTDNISGFTRIPPPGLNGKWPRQAENWIAGNREAIEEAVRNADLIHVTNTGFAGWLGAQLKKEQNLPLLLTEHAIYWKEIEMGAVALECGYPVPEEQQFKTEVIRIFQMMATEVYRLSDRVITVSQSNIPFQKELGVKEPRYIPNGIGKNWLHPDAGTDENQPVIGWVGRCAEMKNPMRIFDVADAFRRKGLSPSFKILLSDANEKDLEKRVAAKAVSYPEMDLIWNQPSKNYYPDFDFLLISSHNESQPLVMLEAMAHKVIPAGWEVGDLTKEYGLVVPADAGDDELAGAIASLWSNRKAYEEMAVNIYKKVKENHIWADIFNEYHQVMGELVNQ